MGQTCAMRSLQLYHVVHHSAMRGWLTLPKVFSRRSSPVQQLAGGETRGGLGHFTDCAQDVGQELVPIFPVGVHALLEHLFKCLVKTFHEPVCLGVVHRCPELLYLEEAKQFFDHP